LHGAPAWRGWKNEGFVRRLEYSARKVVDYDLEGDEWKSKVAGSKFKDYPHYGLAASGAIGIQGDHDGTLAIRHMRIRELP
jgi:hypothetical protein